MKLTLPNYTIGGARGTGAGYKWDFKASEMTEIFTREDVVNLFYDKMGIDKKKIKQKLSNTR